MSQMLNNQARTLFQFRLVGYGLLGFALLTLIELMIPFRWTDPLWELQIIGGLVEQAPLLLLGLMLVLCGEGRYRSRWGVRLAQLLSWAAIGMGVLFLLLVPLLVRDSARLQNSLDTRLHAQASQRLSQLEQVETQISQGDEQVLEQIANQLNPEETNDSFAPQALQNLALEKINEAKVTIQKQVQERQQQQRWLSTKKMAKWLLGAFLAGGLFISLGITGIQEFRVSKRNSTLRIEDLDKRE